MRTFVRFGASAVLIACLGAIAVQAGAAEKPARTDSSRTAVWNADWMAAPAVNGAWFPDAWTARRLNRRPGSPWDSNAGALILNAPMGSLTLTHAGTHGDPPAPNQAANLASTSDPPFIPGTINSSWKGGTGNWNVAGDWSPSGIPNNGGGNTYNVTIDSGGTDDVSLNINATIASLVLGGSTGSSTLQNIANTAESLTVTGATTINTTGALIFGNSSILKFEGGLTVDGTYDLQLNGATATVTGSALINSGGGGIVGDAGVLTVNGTLTNSGVLYTGYVYGGGNTVTVNGGFTNNGQVYMYGSAEGGTGDTLTVTGALTNAAGSTLYLYDGSGDVASVGTLSNSGSLYIGNGTTFTLTNQPNGITDVPLGSTLTVNGTLKAGTANGLANLGSVEGALNLYNGQSTTATPGTGTLTIASTGYIDLELGSTLTVAGNLSNSGYLYTGEYAGYPANTLTVNGAFTNNAGAYFYLGDGGGTTDVANVQSLVNNGYISIGGGATLNLTNQPNGITDVAAGSTLLVYGNLKAGSANGLAKLGSVEGTIGLDNGQSSTVTPGGGTLTVSNTGIVGLNYGTTLTIAGNVNNSGTVETDVTGGGYPANILTVNGTFTNNAGAYFYVGYDGTTDVANVQSLVNNGYTYIGTGATLNLTNQPNGITDVSSTSTLIIYGSLKAGSANGLANLGSVEGALNLYNGQSTTATPGTGTLTIASTGYIDLELGSTLTVAGNLSNSGYLYTGEYAGYPASTLTVNGAFTNNAGAYFYLGDGGGTTDVANVQSLVNNGYISIGGGATLNLTNQPNGITDVAAGSTLLVYGNLKAGSANGLAKLGSVEGTIGLDNGQSSTVTPGGGTLTVSNTGIVGLNYGTTLTIAGNVNNSGTVETDVTGGGYPANILTVNGTFTNNAGAYFYVGYDGTTDVANAQSLVNNGYTYIGTGATLNLTNQPNGITDVSSTSTLIIYGSLKAGTANGLANLGSVEGALNLYNGQSTTATPGTGTLTIASTGYIDLELGSTLTVAGNLSNSGYLYTGEYAGYPANTLTVNGAFTNNAGAYFYLGDGGGTTDVANVQSLVNNGYISIGGGATLNLTNQPNGITDVAAGSTLLVYGNLKAGSSNGLAELGSVEGTIGLDNGQSSTVTPGGGTLTVSNTGIVGLNYGTTLTIAGNVNNSGTVETDVTGGGYPANILTVNGTFTNNAGAYFYVGCDGTTDVANAQSLVNNGYTYIGTGATLNLTNQPNGITDVSSTSTLIIYGSLKAGSANGLANLGSVEGALNLYNGQSTTATPGTGTLTIASTGYIDLELGSTLTVAGNLSNSGYVYTGFYSGYPANTLTVNGTFTNNAGAYFYLGYNDATTDVANLGTLSNSGTLYIGSGTLLNLTASGTDTNTGTITLGSTSGPATLQISASAVTLSGSGTLTMSTGTVITAAAPTDILTSANTIEGSGNIGNGAMGFVNSATGTVLANQSTPLVIDPSSSGFNNQGTLNVSAGDTLQITGPANSFLNYSSSAKTLTGGAYVVSGTLQFGATGNTITTNDSSITLSGSAAKIITPTGGNMIAPLATNGAGALFEITNGYNFTTQGNFTNNGTLTVGSSNSKFEVKSGSSLTNFSGTTLTGGTYQLFGTLEFGATGSSITTDDANITLTGASAKIINLGNQNMLSALASIGAGSSLTIQSGANLTTSANFTNNGTITVGSGDTFSVTGNLTNISAGAITGGTYNLTGILKATNASGITTNSANITLTGSGALENQSGVNALAGLATNSSGSSFTITGGANFTTAGAFTNSGTLTVGSGSTFNSSAGSYTNAGATTVQNGGVFMTAGTVTNTGTASLSSTGSNTELQLTANATLTGTGTLTLSNNAANLITASAGTDVLTNSSTIQGSGTISGLLLANSGTVDADQGTSLIVSPSTGTNTNTATLEASAGGTLDLMGTWTNAGGTILATGTGSQVLLDGAAIGGGTLTSVSGGVLVGENGATLNGSSGTVTISTGSTLQVSNGETLNASGTITNNGTITLNSTGSNTELVFTGAADTLGGTGKLILGANADNIVTASASSDVLTNSETIEGSGNLGDAKMGLVNNTGKSIIANQSTPLIIDTSSKGFNNKGTLSVSAGDTLEIMGPFTNFSAGTLTGGTYTVTGILDLPSGDSITSNAATITLTGAAAEIKNPAGSGSNALGALASNASTGIFTVTGGQALTDSTTAVTNAGTLTVAKNSKLTLSAASGTYTQSAGTTTVDGTLTAKGGITFNGGSVFGNGGTLSAGTTGTVTDNATFNIGDTLMTAGKETITGAYSQTSTGAINIDIGGTTAGTQFDQLTISSTASLNGVLNLDLINGFVPTLTETFDILNASSVTGTFATVNGTSINSNEHFGVVYNANNVTLDVLSGPVGSGGWGGGSPGSGSGSGSPSTPEPGSLVLLGSGLLGLWRLARRRPRI